MTDLLPNFPQRIRLLLWPCLTLTCLGWIKVSPCFGQDLDFAKQIRPILNKHCLACHGRDAEHREADLRLDNFEDATASVIVPGKPADSELFRRISSKDPDDVMPPADHGSLTAAEIDLIRQWIEQGAPYAQHWAFIRPQQPPVPRGRFDDWAYNEIDHFIAARMESKQLSPSEQAAWHRLIRRAALDLTGLPPTDAQIQQIVEQPSLKTYEALVDEWLASPGFGEHWAAMWLDLARYADTIGYTEDHARTIWPWRDWVIRSFNENKSFDQFTIEQLAGDLLPDASEDQRLATAFHRNTVSNSEGGTIDEEFRVIAVKDRINTTVNVWMGLTMRCAECHTHKYDPISIEEYYQFYDFFNQTADSDRPDEEPRLDLLSDEQKQQLSRLNTQIEELKQRIQQAPPNYSVLRPLTVESTSKSTWRIHDDQSVGLVGEVPDTENLVVSVSLPAGEHHGLRLDVLPEPEQGNTVGRSENGNFILSLIEAEIESLTEPQDNQKSAAQPVKFSDAAADFVQIGYEIDNIIRPVSDEGGWAVSGAPDGLSSRRVAVLTFEQPLQLVEPKRLRVRFVFRSKEWKKHIISRLQIATTPVEKPADKFRRNEFNPFQAELNELLAKRDATANPTKVPVMQELPADQRRTTSLLTRGSYLSPGEALSAAVPDALHAFPAGAPLNRLGVARWLIAPENPLTARVTVNRFWARMFGRGIVETEEDFGTQGSIPTHPELLDWLAVDFQTNGWNMKRLLKQMVMSATYRQSSQATPERLETDPLNLYLSRGPRGRLSAEVVRDQALMVSGLLSAKMYGPPVFPPSPIKKIRNSFAGDFVWNTSTGEDRYRRAIYTFLKRSQPHPLFETFDMSTRQVCSFRRINTNTPLQSFMTLNDEAFVECARQLALKMTQHSTELESRIRFGLETALRQPADEFQIETLTKLVATISQQYTQDLAAARTITGIGESPESPMTDDQLVELASLTVAANVILNLDGFITR